MNVTDLQQGEGLIAGELYLKLTEQGVLIIHEQGDVGAIWKYLLEVASHSANL